MSLGGELRKEDVAHNSLPVDDVRHPTGQPKGRWRSIARSDCAARVTHQSEGKSVLLGEPPVRFHRVGTNSYDFRPGSPDDLVAVPKGAGFLRADSRVIPRIEVEDDICLSQILLETDFCA